MTSTDDDKLAQLLGLGFDIDVCRAALLQNTTVEAATEWILGNETNRPVLAPQPSSEPAMRPQVVESRQHKEAAEAQAAHMREQSLKMSVEAKKEKRRNQEARQRALAQIKEDREKQKMIRGSHTPKQPASSSQSEGTAYERAQQEIKKQKRLDREAKNRALLEIKQDRENMKMRHASTSKPQAAAAAPQPSLSKARQNRALVQFKLSDGSAVRHEFEATALLSELFAFAKEKEGKEAEQIHLISAFPKREFTEDEESMTVRDAGFVPNVSLNVIRWQPQVSEKEIEALDNNTERKNKHHAPAEVQESNNNIRGQDVEMQEASDGDRPQSSDEESQDEEMPDAFDHPAINPHRPPVGRVPFARRGRVTNPNWNWGTGGHRLTEDNQDQPQQQQQQVDEPVSRQNMLSAIERRGAATSPPQQQHARGKTRDIRSLRDTCAVSVAGLLTQPTLEARSRVRNLIYASPKISELLLAQLIHSRKLERVSMKRLADHCYLQNVILDSYVYATDSLLQELSLSNSSSTMVKLSLKGCDVITDSGVRFLEGLRNLEYLDASNCKVTDKGIRSLTRLSQLKYLNLSKTKITDAGLQYLVANACFKDSLETLLLDGCPAVKSSDTLMLINDAFSGLVSLGLASTGIGRQTAVSRPKLVNLQLLDISHTRLTDDDAIQTICAYKELRELRLAGCSQITLRGLGWFAKDLRHLEMIQFPSREQDLDGVLTRYAELPLRHLDLTSFQVTDEGADSIARMKRLQYLSLDGTKISDEGVSKLSGLSDLRKLFLDRTAVSDAGISQLIGMCNVSMLTKLDTLSLSRTQVSNAGLMLLGDFEQTGFTRCLRTLNLAQCSLVSDAGVRGLKGMVNLTNINLDHTHVSRQCLRHLQVLEHLKPVRLLGISRDEDDEEEALV
ncbi:hypothetical protein BJV82DRAFT_666651 [Fennellomyces sp. T-0311]|nr:hypothetical protein BJV82DRAFT_666651 [Fennellomyces sp. T-0311]